MLRSQFTTKKLGGIRAADVEKFDRGRIRVECLRVPPGTTPELISVNLPTLAKDHDTRMIVFGESTAHYICKAGLDTSCRVTGLTHQLRAKGEVELDPLSTFLLKS